MTTTMSFYYLGITSTFNCVRNDSLLGYGFYLEKVIVAPSKNQQTNQEVKLEKWSLTWIKKEHPCPQYQNFTVISKGFHNNTKKINLSEAL